MTSHDLTHRAHLDEAMDSLVDRAVYRRCLRDMDRISRLALAHRPTLAFLDQVAATHPGPLHILDVACGDGAMLRRIATWAKRKGIAVELTGLDLHPWAIERAGEYASPPIRYLIEDVFRYTPPVAPDVILTAHFTHHLPEPDLLRFLAWMHATARKGWFINDLQRHPNPYRNLTVLARFLPLHPVILSDALISIRRAFTVEDWQRLTLAAGIPDATITEQFPARVTVASLKR